jgi:hypothetical protein
MAILGGEKKLFKKFFERWIDSLPDPGEGIKKTRFGNPKRVVKN